LAPPRARRADGDDPLMTRGYIDGDTRGQRRLVALL
jgi:hypothetical protein